MTGIWGTEPYPINGSDYSGKFRSSTVIPFRTSLEIQVLECAPSSPSTQVRFILNGESVINKLFTRVVET